LFAKNQLDPFPRVAISIQYLRVTGTQTDRSTEIHMHTRTDIRRRQPIAALA